jgi:tetratricopeptide (TPR) repeat protein
LGIKFHSHLLILLFCLLVFFSQSQTDSLPPEEKHVTLYKEGLKLIDSSDYKGAITVFKKATKAKRDYFEAYLKSGYCKMKLKDFSGAEKDFTKAQETGPNDFETLKLKGINYFLMENYKEAKTCLDSALNNLAETTIDDPEFFYYQAKLMYVGKSYKQALASCEIALESNPKYYEVFILKCEIRYAAKEYAYALRELNETIKVLPENKKDYNLYKMRARCKFELKDYKGSAADWDVYIEAMPGEEDSYIERAAANINANNYTKAIVDLDEALKLNPKNPVSYCYRGLAKGSNKQIVEGIKDLDMAIKLKFDYSAAFVNRAALRMAAKDKRGACEDLQKADSLGNDMAPGLFEQYCK